MVHLDGAVYDQPRETLTREQKDASLRYQIMDVVDDIRWIPGFGYERELDWLMNMHDWMISKKRYWGLALPIYDCPNCGTYDVIGGIEDLEERAQDGWDRFKGHTPHRPYIDEVTIRCSGCGEPVKRIPDVGNPWLDAGITPFSTIHYREDKDFWEKWFPADFITESFPGQFRNWFYAMLAMSTVLRKTAPFKTIFGYGTLIGEDGRPMHKSWGNSIEFDEAAERHGRGCHALAVHVGQARGQHPLRLAYGRRRPTPVARALEHVLVLRDLRPARGLVSRRGHAAEHADGSLDPVARGGARDGSRGTPPGCRSRGGCPLDRHLHRGPVDLVPAPLATPVLAQRRRGRSRLGLLDAARDAGRAVADRRTDPAVHGRFDVRQPGRRLRRRGAGLGPPHALAVEGAGEIRRPLARDGNGNCAPRR